MDTSLYWELFTAAFIGSPIWRIVYRRKYKGLFMTAVFTFFTIFFLGFSSQVSTFLGN